MRWRAPAGAAAARRRARPALPVGRGTYAGAPGDTAACWDAFQDVVAEYADELRDGMRQAPQTNEVGRGAALVGGLCHLAGGLPVRLVEIGASAGLNMRADAFCIEHVGSADVTGPPDSSVRLAAAWQGNLPQQPVPEVVDRSGVDLSPVDPLTTDGRLLLTSYVWADQIARFERLRAAFVLAERVPATVRQGAAADAVEALTLHEGTTTVLWHSVTWQYLDDDEQRRVAAGLDALGATATPTRRFARVTLEPEKSLSERASSAVRLRQWPAPSGAGDETLGHASAHGLPVTWV